MNAISKVIGLLLVITLMISCNMYTKNNKQEIASIEEAFEKIDNYKGNAEDFILQVPLQKKLTSRGNEVPMDLSMVIITDKILKRGWMLNGFEDRNGVRIYKYKVNE